MPCYSPIPAFRTPDGVVFAERQGADVVGRIDLACGQCVGCRLKRSLQWATRVMHEASLHDENCFLTLTYSDEYLPSNWSLDYRDFQLFMKRLRKAVKRPIRFYMCGEYGDENFRPHFHACLFGVSFLAERVPASESDSGHLVYEVPLLRQVWPFGLHTVGDLTFQSAAYVSRYVMKKVTGKAADAHYEQVDRDGVITSRVPEFNRMSLRPGIGARWIDRYRDDVYPHDFVVRDGFRSGVPKYYDRRVEAEHGLMLEDVKWKRAQRAAGRREDNTDDRLVVKRKLDEFRVQRLRRSV